MRLTRMPVNRIVWGGLTSWGGIQPSPGAHDKKLAAVKFFEKAGMRRRAEASGQSNNAVWHTYTFTNSG